MLKQQATTQRQNNSQCGSRANLANGAFHLFKPFLDQRLLVVTTSGIHHCSLSYQTLIPNRD